MRGLYPYETLQPGGPAPGREPLEHLALKAGEVYLWTWASLVAQLVKNLPAMQETRVQFLGRKDPLEKEMATYSGVLAWRIQEPGRL